MTRSDGLRHETSGLCEKTNSIYSFYLLLTAVVRQIDLNHMLSNWTELNRPTLTYAGSDLSRASKAFFYSMV